MRHSAPERGARREGSGFGRAGNLLAALLAVLLLLPGSLLAQNAITALNGVITTGASASLQTSSASAVEVHIWSASTSTSTILIQQSLNGSAWYTVATITNVAAAGQMWIGPPAPLTRVNVTARGAGTLYATVAPLARPQNVTGWKLIEANPATTSSITSIAVTAPGGFSVTGSPLTSNGTIAIASGTTLTGTTGTGAADWHIVKGEGALSSGSLTVTLSGAAVYTGNTTFVCTVNTKSATAGNIKALGVTYTSGTAFVVKSADAADAQTVSFLCIGN